MQISADSAPPSRTRLRCMVATRLWEVLLVDHWSDAPRAGRRAERKGLMVSFDLRRPTLTASVWRRRVSAALSLGSKMRPFEATHVLAFVLPVAGMLPAVVAAIGVYYLEGTIFRGGDDPDLMLRFTPIAISTEPFAALSNIAFAAVGTGLFLMPMLSGSFLAPHAIGAGVLFAYLGASSWAFHVDASRIGSWQHAIDRIGMFTTMGYLGIVVIGGAFHSVTGRPATPRSLCSLLTNISCMVVTFICIAYQDRIDSTYFLGGCGTLVVAANALTAAMLQWRASEHSIIVHPSPPMRRAWRLRCGALCDAKGDPLSYGIVAPRWFVAVVEGVVEAGIVGLLLFIGLAINRQAAACRSAAAHNATLPASVRIELNARHDMLHGTWHCLISIVLMSMALTMHRGLCSLESRASSPTQAVLDDGGGLGALSTGAGGVYERIARFMCGALALLMWMIRDAPVRTLVLVWALVVGVTIPAGGFMIWRITRQNDARWLEKRRALGMTRRWRTKQRLDKVNAIRPAKGGPYRV